MPSVSKVVIAYLVMVNLVGFWMCLWDKRRAVKNLWRIPERRFFLTAVLGGGPGVLAGMYAFRHKTRHRTFTVGIPVIIIVEFILILAYIWYFV